MKDIKVIKTRELKEALIALACMYDQYCGDNYGHDFMCAGESAIEIIENYGLGNEKDGVNIPAVDALERSLND